MYESENTLFWTVLLVACRRYARTTFVLPFLMTGVKKELSSAIVQLPLTISTINALILVCTWVFPIVRFVNDPTPSYSSAMMNTAMLLGIHTGKGSNTEFSFGSFQTNFTDEEAAYTWGGYNITSQRVSTYMGIPPLGCLFNQTIQNVIDGRTPFHVPSGFRVLLECQKFSHQVSKTMAACLEETRGVSAHIVKHLEDEFDSIQGLICSERAGKPSHARDRGAGC
jgi:transcriptional regulatory protein LEU3